MRYVATVGFFDGVHRGHAYLIRQLKGRALAEGIGTEVITFDKHPRQVVNSSYVPKMLCTLDEKVRLIEALGVDRCIVLPFDKQLSCLTAEEFMHNVLKEKLGVSTLIIGYDNRFGHGREEGFDDYVRHGQDMDMVVVRALPLVEDGENISSSFIRKAIGDGDMAVATHALGRRYTISGNVVSGYHVGRLIGYPTANIAFEHTENMLPCPGVYAVWVNVKGSTLPGMMNIGCRPTFGGNDVTFEVHIFNFSKDIYGCQVSIAFEQRLRSEMRFTGAVALTEQLHKDAEHAARILNVNIEDKFRV